MSDERFRELVETARSSDEILGLYVFGSRAFDDEQRDERSDYDVGLVVTDDAHESLSRRWPSEHGDSLEVFCFTLDGLRAHAEYGSPNEWARPLFLWIDLVVDKTGELAPVLAAKQRVPEAQCGAVVAEALGAYVNSTYRFLRYGTRLDAAESVPPLLTLVFALEDRVRPFNKHLGRELAHRPLASFDAAGLLASIDGVLDGDRAASHGLFRDVESAARGRGLAKELDGWEPDLAWLRGDAEYRAAR